MGGRHNPAVRADNCSPTAEVEERMSERDEGGPTVRADRWLRMRIRREAGPPRRALRRRGPQLLPISDTFQVFGEVAKIVPTYRRESPYQAGSSSRRSAQIRGRHNADYSASKYLPPICALSRAAADV